MHTPGPLTSASLEPTHQHCCFIELGWEAEVELLADLSDRDEARFRLRLVRTLNAVSAKDVPKDGTVFEAFAPWRQSCLWSLTTMAGAQVQPKVQPKEQP